MIEDGSASQQWGTILGRHVEVAEFRASAGRAALDNGAPDLISPATEAAATALGWTSLQGVADFFGTQRLRLVRNGAGGPQSDNWTFASDRL